MSDLLLRADALPGLVYGWNGPAIVSDEFGETRAWYQSGVAWTEGGEWLEPFAIYLDLSLPECRDRVARVLARVVGLECGSTAPIWWGEPPDPEWALSNDSSRYFIPDERWGRLYHHDRVTLVPSLADIDPSDGARLPDGSRRVDALALKLVCEHVGEALLKSSTQSSGSSTQSGAE